MGFISHYLQLGGGFTYFFIFIPIYLGKMNPFWPAYVSNGLVKNHQVDKVFYTSNWWSALGFFPSTVPSIYGLHHFSTESYMRKSPTLKIDRWQVPWWCFRFLQFFKGRFKWLWQTPMFLHLPRQWKESPKDMAASGPHGIARFYSDALLPKLETFGSRWDEALKQLEWHVFFWC